MVLRKRFYNNHSNKIHICIPRGSCNNERELQDWKSVVLRDSEKDCAHVSIVTENSP